MMAWFFIWLLCPLHHSTLQRRYLPCIATAQLKGQKVPRSKRGVTSKPPDLKGSSFKCLRGIEFDAVYKLLQSVAAGEASLHDMASQSIYYWNQLGKVQVAFMKQLTVVSGVKQRTVSWIRTAGEIGGLQEAKFQQAYHTTWIHEVLPKGNESSQTHQHGAKEDYMRWWQAIFIWAWEVGGQGDLLEHWCLWGEWKHFGTSILKGEILCAN